MNSIDSVLVIDDNPADVELCRIAFRRTERYAYVFSARDGDEALALFLDYEASRIAHPRSFPPRLMLLDINMPRMDGFEFLREFRAIREQILERGEEPSIVVMLTSSLDPRDRERIDQIGGVAGFLNKPLTVDEAHHLAETYGVPAA